MKGQAIVKASPPGPRALPASWAPLQTLMLTGSDSTKALHHRPQSRHHAVGESGKLIPHAAATTAR